MFTLRGFQVRDFDWKTPISYRYSFAQNSFQTNSLFPSIRIDVIFAIELFEQFVLSVFAGQVPTKPMMNQTPASLEQVIHIQSIPSFV